MTIRRPHRPRTIARTSLLIVGSALACACSSEDENVEHVAQDAATASDAIHADQQADGEDAQDAIVDDVKDATADHDGGQHDASTDTSGDASGDADAELSDASDAMGDGGAIDADDASDGAMDDGSDASFGAAGPVCYFGDFDLNGSERVACIRFPSLDREVLAAPDLAAGFEVTAIALSPNGQTLAIAGRAEAPDPVSLQLYSLADGTVTTLAKASGTTQTIERIAFSRDGLWLALMADFAQTGTTSLFAVPVAGGALSRLGPAVQPGLDVIDMAWARGATSPGVLAFVGDVHTDGVRELLTVDATISKPPSVAVLSEAQLGPNGDVQAGVQWDAEGRLVFRSNFENAAVWQLYRAGVGGAGTEVIPGTVLLNGTGQSTIASFALAQDGERIAWSANAPNANVFDVYTVSLASGSPAAARVSSVPLVVPSTGVVGPTLPSSIAWSPVGDSLAVLADWPLGPADRDDNFSVFVLPSESPAGGARLLGAATEIDRNARELQFLSSGAAVVVRGDLIENGAFELFISNGLASTDQDLNATRVEDVPVQGDVLGIAAR